MNEVIETLMSFEKKWFALLETAATFDMMKCCKILEHFRTKCYSRRAIQELGDHVQPVLLLDDICKFADRNERRARNLKHLQKQG